MLMLFGLLALAGCQLDSRQQILASTNSQAAQRAISTRAFDTADRAQVFRAVLATLQDLGFVVDRADSVLGTVSATRFGADVIRLTITLRPSGASRTIVRASGQFNQDALSDPAPFQKFFAALSQALFLDANEID
jgi:hypothetical protein